MVHHHTTLWGNMDIFCSFPYAHCARVCVGSLNQTRAGVHSAEDHDIEGQEECRGKGPAEHQGTCMELSFDRGACFMEKILHYSFSANEGSSLKS